MAPPYTVVPSPHSKSRARRRHDFRHSFLDRERSQVNGETIRVGGKELGSVVAHNIGVVGDTGGFDKRSLEDLKHPVVYQRCERRLIRLGEGPGAGQGLRCTSGLASGGVAPGFWPQSWHGLLPTCAP